MNPSRTSGTRIAFGMLVLLILLAANSLPVCAQGALYKSTGLTGNNGTAGISFEVTAIKSTKIHRLWVQSYSAGSCTVELYYNPTGLILAPGSAGYNPNGWISVGQYTFNGLGTGAANNVEIPYTFGLLMNPGEKVGFAIRTVSGTGVGYMTGVGGPYVFADSYISINTEAWGGTVPTAWSFYVRQFCGGVSYDPGCFFPENVISWELLDAALQPTTFANLPGSVNVRYVVAYPDEQTNVNMTFNLRNVITDAVVYTYNFSATKNAGQTLVGIQNIPIPGTITSGYYKAEVLFNTKNSCLEYANYLGEPRTLLLLPPGATMCIVWPGDTDNNGIVTYADRAALNRYIFDANMRSTWLNGPTRYSVTGGFDYLEWKGQPSAPWNTPDGCYKDTDGNGVINNFDYIAIKLNWLKNNTIVPAKAAGFSAASFAMDQNYPNPFNPSTTIRYAVPERSQVRLVVTDMLGRTVATPVEGLVDQGMHSATFDAADLPSGSYTATVHMSGTESGLSYSRTIKMTLAR
ncbi:MAG TPA: T9SS type A sorting domain-containing protein [Bacteroidota bacterium]|nr:T9SS type A sorting domain-containing protein [Bacteroidota bacterium]